jgi:nucleoid-associated protein YejK
MTLDWDYVHTVMFPSVSKMSFPILSVWRSVHTEMFSNDANVFLHKNSIACDFLSPFIFHQMKSLLVNEFLKMSSAHYNKVNSFICMFKYV